MGVIIIVFGVLDDVIKVTATLDFNLGPNSRNQAESQCDQIGQNFTLMQNVKSL